MTIDALHARIIPRLDNRTYLQKFMGQLLLGDVVDWRVSQDCQVRHREEYISGNCPS